MFPTFASASARTALFYITAGALIVIWTAVWYVYLLNNTPATQTPFYFCGGLLVTGIAFLGIGFGVGQIGRSAKHADIPAETLVSTPAVSEEVVPLTQPTAGMVIPAAPVAPRPVVQTPTVSRVVKTQS